MLLLNTYSHQNIEIFIANDLSFQRIPFEIWDYYTNVRGTSPVYYKCLILIQVNKLSIVPRLSIFRHEELKRYFSYYFNNQVFFITKSDWRIRRVTSRRPIFTFQMFYFLRGENQFSWLIWMITLNNLFCPGPVT